MYRPQSLHEEFSLVYSGDPGLQLPDDVEERATKLRVARETGRWNEIVKPGDEVTVFRFRGIHGTALTWLQGEASRGDLTTEEGFELAFRLSIKSIENFGRAELKFESDRGQRLLRRESLEPLYSIGRDIGEPLLGRAIVLELGALVMDRALQGVPPK